MARLGQKIGKGYMELKCSKFLDWLSEGKHHLTLEEKCSSIILKIIKKMKAIHICIYNKID